MSVNTQSNRVRVFTTTENQTIPIQFPFREDTDLVVERNVSGVYEKLVLSSDYTVSGAGTDDGGTVSLLTVPADVHIRVTRIIDVTQESEYQPNVRLSETQIERDFDKLVMICQQLMTEIQDGVVAPFKGGWDAGSNTPYLEQTPYEDGVYYIVNVSGETWGIEFRIGDILFAVDGEWVRVPSALCATVVEEIYARLDALDEAVDEIEAVLGDATELPVPNTLMERGDAGETGVKYIDLAPLSAEEIPATQAGRVYFDAEKGVMVVGLDDESDWEAGEVIVHVYNNTGATIENGTVVAYGGTTGASGNITVVKAIADGSMPANYIVGVATQDIPNGSDGHVAYMASVRKIDTSMWSADDILYVSQTVAGGYTNVLPTSGLTIPIAVVMRSHAETGVLLVNRGLMAHTDLSYEISGEDIIINSSTGRSVTLSPATTAEPGLMSSLDKTKLDGIEAGAEVNSVNSVAGRTGDVVLTKSDVGLSNVDNTSDLNKPISTATSNALALKVDVVAGYGLSKNDFTDALLSKLDGIESGATVNSSDSYLLDRANHTGTQAISTVVGLQAGLDGKLDKSGGTVTGKLTVSGSTTSTVYSPNSCYTGFDSLPLNAEAILQDYISNKVFCYDYTLIDVEDTSDGITWSDMGLTDQQKKDLVTGRNISSLTIPNLTAKVRITLETNTVYVWLSLFYAYLETRNNPVTISLEKSYDGSSYTAISTATSTEVATGWPTHFYCRHSKVSWHPTPPDSNFSKYVRIVLTPNWKNSSDVDLAFFKWFGHYPADNGKIEKWDYDKNVTFPSDLIANNFRPFYANAYLCGTSSYPWAGGYTQTAFTVTSDEKKKQDIVLLSDKEKELDAGDIMLDQLTSFKYNSAVEKKGLEGARLHHGICYQDVESAFIEVDLDPDRYGMLCGKDQAYETVTKTVTEVVQEERPVFNEDGTEKLDEEGNIIVEIVEVPVEKEVTEQVPVFDDEGNPVLNKGVRTEEIHTLLFASLNRQVKVLEAKINDLQSKLKELES